jgi:hypothetical protein
MRRLPGRLGRPEPEEFNMNSPQLWASKITCAAERHLEEAAAILTQQHDWEDARAPLTAAVFEMLGSGPHARLIINLLMHAMVAQRSADQRERASWRR